MFHLEKGPGHHERPPKIVLSSKDGHFTARFTSEEDSDEVFEGISTNEALGKLLMRHAVQFGTGSILVTKNNYTKLYESSLPGIERISFGKSFAEALGAYAVKSHEIDLELIVKNDW